MHLPVWLLLSLTGFVLAKFSCDDISKCTCQTLNNEINLICERNNSVSLQAKLTQSKQSLQISCNNFAVIKNVDASIFDDLSELNIGDLNYLQMQFCPLPNVSFKQFLDNLKISKVLGIKFDYTQSSNDILSPPFLDNLPFLEELFITNNANITALHIDVFKGVPNLKRLFLRGNAIKELIPGVFQYMPKLDVLDLGSNKIKHLESGIFRNLISLRILNIDFNQLVNVSRPIFNSVPQLESLDLSGNRIIDFPSGIFADLRKLQTLQLNKNIFKTFPSDLLSTLESLKVIKIIHHKYSLIGLPSKLFANLPKLTNITFRESDIRTVPTDLFLNSINIKAIIMTGHKKITSLPRDLFRDSKRLVHLDLSDNNLNDLPEDLLASLNTLQVLNLNKNKFIKIPEYFFGGLLNLIQLDMSQNSLKHIEPTSFYILENLESLDMSSNSLELDNQQSYSPFHKLSELKKLFLANNKIDQIYFDWLTVMTQLESIDLKRNSITSVGDVLSSIISDALTIDLSFNKISIVYMSTLEQIAKAQDYKRYRVPKVVLNDNPIACNCSNYDLIRYTNRDMDPLTYDVVQLVTDSLTCNSTGDLFNKIVPAQVACITDNCPAQCYCIFWPYSSKMTVNCSSVDMKEVPDSLPISYNGYNIKKMHLLLRNNSIEQLPDELGKGYELLSDLNLSNNKIHQLKVYPYFKQLEKLDLSNNQLEYLDDTFIEFLSQSTNLSASSIRLGGNPWECTCNITKLYGFLLDKHEKVINSDQIICKGEKLPLNKITLEEICPSFTQLLISASVSLGVFGIMIGLLVVLYYRYQHEIKVWLFAHGLLLCFVTEEELDSDKKYDVFVSYATEDEPFVEDKLIAGLEKNYFKVCYHMRDWTPGEWIHNQIIKSVEESRRTLIVLSKHFLKSEWGKVEFRTAHCKAVRENRARVIILVYGDEPAQEELDSDMKAYMSMNTYIKWGDPWFWEKLKYALPHPPSKPINKIEMDSNSSKTEGIKSLSLEPKAGTANNDSKIVENNLPIKESIKTDTDANSTTMVVNDPVKT